jgi:hypothetical protein
MSSDAKEAGSSGATVPPQAGSVGGDSTEIQSGSPSLPARKPSRQSGARHTPQYRDTSEEYLPVRRSDLREISNFSWLEHGLGGIGMFFVSGAFWLLPVIFIEHGKDMKDHHWAWVGTCLLSIVFGLVLLWISHRHFKMREQRINDYFKGSSTP